MLIDFQQALADLVASPAFCRAVRADPGRLSQGYDLSPREQDRLLVMVNHPGMALNCMLYRANRLAPLALNLGELCRALGPELGPLITEYIDLHPNTNVHFYQECERFCAFIEAKIDDGYPIDPASRSALEKESRSVRLNLMVTKIAL